MNITLLTLTRKSYYRLTITMLLTWNAEPFKIGYEIVELGDDGFDLEIINTYFDTFKLLSDAEKEEIYSFIAELLSSKEWRDI